MITEQCPTAITVLIMQNIVGLIINAVMLGETHTLCPGSGGGGMKPSEESQHEAAPPAQQTKAD